MAIVALQVHSLGDALLPEYVMTPSYPLSESQVPQQAAQFIEAEVRIRATVEDSLQERAAGVHATC